MHLDDIETEAQLHDAYRNGGVDRANYYVLVAQFHDERLVEEGILGRCNCLACRTVREASRSNETVAEFMAALNASE